MTLQCQPFWVRNNRGGGSCAGWLWLMSLLFGLLPLSAQTNFVTIVTNGPASNRLNVVFLSEGYTSGQFGQFLTDATNTANNFLATAPFAEYAPYLNFFAIAVASVESGSDHPNDGSYKNTYFNSTYDVYNFISIPSGASGQGKVDALLTTFLPTANLTILLVNDPNLGGSDGGGKTAITSIAPVSLAYIPVHEAGHVLAGLGDEYTDANPGYPDIEEPNTTRETNRAAIKWRAWISTNTPVPTPPTGDYQPFVGLFEGAHYHVTGWYRPKLNCLMGSFYDYFCEVCSEALVLSIYRKVRPVDSFTPVATNLTVTSPSALSFTLTTLQPASHTLSFQWLTNGTSVAGATSSTFTIAPAALKNGTPNTIAVRIVDPTPLVRTDPSNLLSQTRSWTLNVSVPQLQLSAPRWLPGAKFAMRVTGVAPQGFAIQASTNLASWLSLSTNSLVNGQFDYTNSPGSNHPSQFFRAVTPP